MRLGILPNKGITSPSQMAFFYPEFASGIRAGIQIIERELFSTLNIICFCGLVQITCSLAKMDGVKSTAGYYLFCKNIGISGVAFSFCCTGCRARIKDSSCSKMVDCSSIILQVGRFGFRYNADVSCLETA